jgi:lipopolysaccharide/colanic/teichoic acid biosynthesis glycosyltransferase
MKRILDIAGALVGVVLISPLLAVVWLAVVLESGLPGLFRQRRMARGGSEFTLYKFRTMTVQRGTERGSFDAGSSARVTRVGKLLRKTKLDELPQLWNVLVGDMSLVGPRPEVRKWVEAYPDRWAKVLAFRPGITDPASIEFRNEEELLAAAPDPETYYREVILPRKLDLYEEYVETRSFWGDVGILLKTVWAVAGR